MNPKKKKPELYKGIYIMDFTYSERKAIANTQNAKAIFIPFEISGAYVHDFILNPPIPKPEEYDFTDLEDEE